MSVILCNSTQTPTMLLQDFQADCELQGLAPETTRRYMSSLGIFEDFLNEHQVDYKDVDKHVLQEFIGYLRNERQVKAKTIENYFSALSALYGYMLYEDLIKFDPITQVRKRYLKRYKNVDQPAEKKLLSVEEMSNLAHSIMAPRDRAILLILAKTGIRRGELIQIDVEDIDRVKQSILLKPKRKRSNRLVFFDEETNHVLGVWLKLRHKLGLTTDKGPLFINSMGGRLNRNGVYTAITTRAETLGFHNSKSQRSEDHFSPHCCRHWFTTHLRRAGMSREFRAWLRGDILRDAQDRYDHIEPDEVRREYLRCIPQFGL